MALEGWEVREKELKVQLERVVSERETKEAEMLPETVRENNG